MNSLPQSVEKEIRARELLPESGSVLLAVSGGLDSMVLLHVMYLLAPQHGWKLVVAHFNHGLLEIESDLDQSFVQPAAGHRGLECATDSGDVRGWVAESGRSVEMAARDLRHRFLAKAAREAGADRIVLAHHANDQAELFLLRLLRGINGQGLGGMKWQNQSPADPSLRLARPFLGTSRAEIESYATSQRIEYREDASNSDIRILRNRIRHEVLPLLHSIEPEIENRLVRSAETLAEQADALKVVAREWLESRKENFDLLPVALQRTILHEQLISATVEPTFQLIEDLRLNCQQIFSVTPARNVTREKTGRLQVREIESRSFVSDQVTISFHTAGSVRFSERIYSWILTRHPTFEPLQNTELFDARQIGELATLRYWQPGDRFQPIGFSSPAKLQNLFTSAKVPAAAKRKRAVGAIADGTIFWVEGLRIGELFKVTPSTEIGLRWSWQS
ncbi:MAG: tRNA(Ile)-lysidine synthase [Verrucomicrobiales bacterium]|nr:tRNA(Ile)-lysidine synthase [Verrucomicrobiales bacterium]